MKRKLNAGFTLIELMIVVAIIGVLAVLAIYGVSKYLRTAKTAEATNSIGAINRGAVAAYDRETATAQVLTTGGTSSATAHNLCKDSTLVPAAIGSVSGVKYQAVNGVGADYNTGDQVTGWKCLRYEMSEPQYYQYAYTASGTGRLPNAPSISGAAWLAEAAGDLDNNGTSSNFTTGGAINAAKQAITFTQISITNETE